MIIYLIDIHNIIYNKILNIIFKKYKNYFLFILIFIIILIVFKFFIIFYNNFFLNFNFFNDIDLSNSTDFEDLFIIINECLEIIIIDNFLIIDGFLNLFLYFNLSYLFFNYLIKILK
jgi:hypothetical protein